MDACRQCGSPDLFEADVTIPAGPVRFVHCRACEFRCWTDSSGERVLPLSEVLTS